MSEWLDVSSVVEARDLRLSPLPLHQSMYFSKRTASEFFHLSYFKHFYVRDKSTFLERILNYKEINIYFT